MKLRQTTLSAFWDLLAQKKQAESEKNPDINQVQKGQRFSSKTTCENVKTALQIQDIKSNVNQSFRPSLIEKTQKNNVKVSKTENQVSQKFKKSLTNLICNINKEKDNKSGQSTASNTTQEQKNQPQKRKNSLLQSTYPKDLNSTKIQESQSLFQLQQTSTSLKVEKQEILRLKKKMKNQLPIIDNPKFEQVIVSQQIQNAQIRFWNGFQYLICQENNTGSDSVWVNTKQILKLNPNWLLKYFNNFI